MNRLFILFSLILISSLLTAQTTPIKYWVQFTDKNNTPYSIDNPSAFLSQKALDRREKNGIAIQENDIPVNKHYIDSIKSFGVDYIHSSRWFNSITIRTTDANIINQIKAVSFVSTVEISARGTVKSDNNGAYAYNGNTTNPIKKSIKKKDDYYGFSRNQVSMISCDIMHAQGYRGEGVVIAMLDAGYNKVDQLKVFDSIRINGQILGTRDFVEPGSNVYEKASHGMTCLSCIAGNIPGKYIGTAPKASFWLLRTEDSGSEYVVEEDSWVAGAEFADSVGADVISSSVGYTEFDDTLMGHWYNQLDGKTARVSIGANIVSSKGIIVVNSAGNSGTSPWMKIGAPADADSVLAIAAVDFRGNFSAFSSNGPSFDGRIKPNVAAQGEYTFVATVSNEISTSNGTSFSTPIIAGAVACLVQANPDKKSWLLRKAIEKSGSQFSKPDSLLGYGIPNFAIANAILNGTKIHNINKESTFSFFPNPFNDILNFMFFVEDSCKIKFEIYNIKGKKIYEKEEVKSIGYQYFTLNDLTKLDTGTYVLKVYIDEKECSKKIVKQ